MTKQTFKAWCQIIVGALALFATLAMIVVAEAYPSLLGWQ